MDGRRNGHGPAQSARGARLLGAGAARRMIACAALLCLGLAPSCDEDPLTAPVNGAPRAPNSPVPADDAVYGRPTLDLSWECSDPDDDALVYSVQVREHDAYTVFSATTPNPEIETGLALLREALYTWRVSASDGIDVTHGPWWSLTTPEWSNEPPYQPIAPTPADGAEGVSVTPTLFWAADDPDQDDPLTFDICFGVDPDPALTASGVTQTAWDPPSLEYSTEYFWRVVARDSRGDSASSAIWSFTTRPEPGGLLARIQQLLGKLSD
jgi:hypothetical protein